MTTEAGLSAWCHRHGCKAHDSGMIDEQCPGCPMQDFRHLLAKPKKGKHVPPNIFKSQRDARFNRQQRAKRRRD